MAFYLRQLWLIIMLYNAAAMSGSGIHRLSKSMGKKTHVKNMSLCQRAKIFSILSCGLKVSHENSVVIFFLFSFLKSHQNAGNESLKLNFFLDEDLQSHPLKSIFEVSRLASMVHMHLLLSSVSCPEHACGKCELHQKQSLLLHEDTNEDIKTK